jgi:hypothetical protein
VAVLGTHFDGGRGSLAGAVWAAPETGSVRIEAAAFSNHTAPVWVGGQGMVQRSWDLRTALMIGEGRGLYDLTFSRTVWRLYGGAKGLVIWYYPGEGRGFSAREYNDEQANAACSGDAVFLYSGCLATYPGEGRCAYSPVLKVDFRLECALGGDKCVCSTC